MRIDPDNADHHSPAWSPDGNWIAYNRVRPREQLMRAPAGGGAPVPIATLDWQGGPTDVAWSPSGEWIAWAADTITLYSPDGKQQKKLSDAPKRNIGFSKDGKTLYSYYRGNRPGQWVIDAFDVVSGRSRRGGTFELDPTTSLRGFSLHPDGRRFLATLVKNNSDIVLMEGF
jgi:Tol biopolymer transport system component